MYRGDVRYSSEVVAHQPYLGAMVTAASGNAALGRMKRDRRDVRGMASQCKDTFRSSAVGVQQPYLGGVIIAASHKILSRWMKRDRQNRAAVRTPLFLQTRVFQCGNAFWIWNTEVGVQQKNSDGTIIAAGHKVRSRRMKREATNTAVLAQRGDARWRREIGFQQP
jgi:hypothetical protein